MPKKRIDIEDLLTWAYVHELPKQSVGGLTGWERLVLLGTTVDERPQDSYYPAILGDPHPDALLIDWRVRNNLPDAHIAWPAARAPLVPDLSPYVDDRDPVVSTLQVSTVALVMVHAKMRTRPRWDIGQPTLRRVLGPNNKPVVEGITPGGRYGYGAACPLRLDPPATEIVSARFEYAAWHAALSTLAGESWNLADHVPLPPRAAAQPWVCDDEKKRRILWSIPRSAALVSQHLGGAI